MKTVKKIETVEYKKSKIDVELEYYYDDDLEEYYVDEELGNSNLRKIRNEYRRINNLLLDYNIKQIRDKYKLSQKDFAILLGFGEVTITRYESKTVQDKAQDMVIRNARDPEKFLAMALNNKDKFIKSYSEERFEEVLKIINDNLSKNYIEIEYNRRNFTDDLVGKQELSLNKVYAIIKELSIGVNKLTKTKLAKLLWYIDFIFFKNNDKGITGLSYCHLPYGAVPYLYEEILNSDKIKMDVSYSGDSSICLIQDCKSDISLEDCELEIVNKVMDKFKNMNTRDIVDSMHNERAYIETKNNQFISYEYASFLSL